MENAGTDFQLSVAGSSFLVRYRSVNFQICCWHQLANLGRDARDVRLATLFSGKTIIFGPANGYSMGEQATQFENMRDLLVGAYPTIAQENVNRRFLPVSADQLAPLKMLDVKKVIAQFFIGFPSQALGYDLHDAGDRLSNLRTRWIKLLVEPAPTAIQFEPNRDYYRTTTPLDENNLDPDGLSGSPIYSVYLDNADQCCVCITGMITHVSRSGVLAVYDADVIRRLLDTIVPLPREVKHASFS